MELDESPLSGDRTGVAVLKTGVERYRLSYSAIEDGQKYRIVFSWQARVWLNNDRCTPAFAGGDIA